MAIFRQSIYVLFSLYSIYHFGAATQCYEPDGTAASADYQPCNSGGQSMCCAVNRSSGASKCRSEGLCFQDSPSVTWRETCTDPTWKDPACLPLCISGTSK